LSFLQDVNTRRAKQVVIKKNRVIFLDYVLLKIIFGWLLSVS
jgi:hypothetical protein